MRTRSRTLIGAAVAALVLTAPSGQALAAPKVVASVPPLHSLVAAVMQGVGEPVLLIPGGASPHSFALRPSVALSLHEADVVFWVGEFLETALAGPLESLAGNASVMELAELPGITLLPIREAGVFDADNHDDYNEHAAHDAQADDGDDHTETDAEAHDHELAVAAEHDHRHSAFDGHIWLSLENAERIVGAAVDALSAVDRSNAAAYAANGAAMRDRLHSLERTLGDVLAPVSDRPYVVFHDAYQYLERDHELSIAGAITIDPEQRPGARRLTALQARIHELNAVCVFSEPQFPADLVKTIVGGTDAKTAVLDPLGSTLAPGPDLYFELMESLAGALHGCLAETS